MVDEPFELPPASAPEREDESTDERERVARELRRPRTPYSRRRRLRPLRWIASLVVLAVIFAAGLFVGRALEEAPEPGGEFTRVRTVTPSTVGPQTTVTVTVTE